MNNENRTIESLSVDESMELLKFYHCLTLMTLDNSTVPHRTKLDTKFFYDSVRVNREDQSRPNPCSLSPMQFVRGWFMSMPVSVTHLFKLDQDEYELVMIWDKAMLRKHAMKSLGALTKYHHNNATENEIHYLAIQLLPFDITRGERDSE